MPYTKSLDTKAIMDACMVVNSIAEDEYTSWSHAHAKELVKEFAR